jgi:Tol biopolymer transport system component
LKLERFDVIVWGLLLLIALAAGAVLLIGDQVGARIVGTRPEAGGQLAALGQIQIEFGQAMNQPSVESAFSIEPAISGKFIWREKTVTFIPSQPFQRNITYTARLNNTAASTSGQTVKQELAWQFSVRAPAVIYIAPASETRELWIQPLEGEAQAVTATGGRVYDFAVAPTGEQVVYSLVNEAGGVDLWKMDRDGSNQQVLVECGADRCTVPAWSPDSGQVAFTREAAGIAQGAPRGAPRVWIYDFATGQASQLYADTQLLGYGPSWSPDGRRLAAWDGSVGSIRVVELATGDMMLLKTQSGMVGTWSPDGGTMLFNELSFVSEQTYVKMYLADFATKQVSLAFETDQKLVDYSVPVWSPDGVWIAAGIKTPTSGLGSQLWVMRPNGTEARPIAGEIEYTYGAYRWNPWSDGLVFQRFALGVPFAKPEILLWSATDNSVRVFASDASMPAWLP